jgi:hypothetical protein
VRGSDVLADRSRKLNRNHSDDEEGDPHGHDSAGEAQDRTSW